MMYFNMFHTMVALHVLAVMTILLFIGKSMLRSPSENRWIYIFQRVFLKSNTVLWPLIIGVAVLFPLAYGFGYLTGTLAGIFAVKKTFTIVSVVVQYLFFILALFAIGMNRFTRSNPVAPAIADPVRMLALAVAVTIVLTVVAIVLKSYYFN